MGGFLSGLAAGALVLGLGGRLVMSLLVLVQGGQPEWSLGGTAQVVILGTAMGPPAGVLFALVKRRLPSGLLHRGLTFGAVHGAIWVGAYFLRPTGPVELRAAPVRGAILFGVLLLGFGVTLAALDHALSRPVPDPRRRNVPLNVAIGIAALGALVVAVLALVSR